MIIELYLSIYLQIFSFYRKILQLAQYSQGKDVKNIRSHNEVLVVKYKYHINSKNLKVLCKYMVTNYYKVVMCDQLFL